MERLRGNLPLLLIWLAVCAVLILVTRGQIMTGIGWDPDDQLRMVQLRDWLGGQSWFDTTNIGSANRTASRCTGRAGSSCRWR